MRTKSMKADPELTEMLACTKALELLLMLIRLLMLYPCVQTLGSEMETLKKSQIKILEMKTAVSKMKQ